ncbi:MAG: acyltransferase [Mariprofundaceae bacterium]|nr:acyltransferase [Mariprofundaceae bacterium]
MKLLKQVLEKLWSGALRDNFFVHPNALVDDGAKIGKGSRIWAFAHILSGARVGKECNICDHTFIESGVVLGDRVTVKCGVFIWEGAIIENDVFIGPNVTFTNDLRPRSKQYGPDGILPIKLRKGCSIGANATLLPHVTIGEFAMIGAASVVTRDVPAHALFFGGPARQSGWVCRCARKLNFIGDRANCCDISYLAKDGKLGVENAT